MESPNLNPDWLTLQSTIGSLKMPMPEIPDHLDLGFPVPNAPTTTAHAIATMQQLRANGGLPSPADYNTKFDGLRQNRLSFALLKLMLQCLDVWASDPQNAQDALYTFKGRQIRAHQLCPLIVTFLDGAKRETAHRHHEAALIAAKDNATQRAAALIDAMEREKAASGTIRECTLNRRVNAANIYLVSTKKPPRLRAVVQRARPQEEAGP